MYLHAFTIFLIYAIVSAIVLNTMYIKHFKQPNGMVILLGWFVMPIFLYQLVVEAIKKRRG